MSELLNSRLPSPLLLLEEDQELGHVLPAGSLEELPDDVGADLVAGIDDLAMRATFLERAEVALGTEAK